MKELVSVHLLGYIWNDKIKLTPKLYAAMHCVLQKHTFNY